MTWLAVGIGGAIGSLGRHLVNVATARAFGHATPIATATVNLVGCAVIGALAGAIAVGSLKLPEAGRVFLFVGILGGFTTFSSFALDTLTLARAGQVGTAFLNIAVQVIGGLAAVFAGFWFATALGR